MTTSGDDEWVAVAVITRPHALRGAVLAKPYTRTIDDFVDAPLEKVALRRDGRIIRHLTIETLAVHKGMPLLRFVEIQDIDAAEELRGAEIVIPEDERWDLPEGRYYVDELVGLDLVEEDGGRSLGPVLRIQEGAAHDFIVFTSPFKKGHEVWLPFIDEFARVDLENDRILVKLPEGLLEL